MFKLSFLAVTVIVLVVFEMLIGKTAAGDCNGSNCGCYKGYCWAYASTVEASPGDWWCYTQVVGTVGKKENWQKCAVDNDCSWDRSCGNCRQHKGNNDERYRDVC
jgi:hypothetical protein